MWRDPHPKPSYLFALVGGNLASFASDFTTMSGNKVDLRIYVEPGKENRCAWAMDSLKRSMKWDEERFGREYDLDVFNIVAVSDFNMGAMENKGLNIFNDALVLASPETATDSSFMGIERVIAHEYFHNWTGNRITCRDWFQLCLKEGLTVFRDQEFGADERSATEQRISEVRQLKARQFPEDAGPLAHPVRPDRYIEINNFYTATVYQKGAELVRMIQTLLGREGFRKGMDLYFERHDGQAATVEDFVACFEDASGKDLKQFMTWYSQAGTPELVCQIKYDAKAKTADLTVTQVLPPTPGEARKKPLHIPIKLGLLGGNGQDLELTLASGERLQNGVIELRKRTEKFRFRDVPSPPVVSLLREFSAPVNLTIDRTDAELQFLMANDSDLFNRWQAAQDYATRVLLHAIAEIQDGGRPAQPKAFIEALSLTIADDDLEPGYRAQFLYLPSESDLARVIGQDVDPLGHPQGPPALRKAVGTRLYEAFCRGLPAHGDQRALFARPEAGWAARLAQRRAGIPDQPRPAGRYRPGSGAFSAKPQPDRRNGGSLHAFRAECPGANGGFRSVLRALEGRSSGDRQLVCLSGRLAAGVLSGNREKAHASPAVLDEEPQQGAGTDRHLRHGEPGDVQPARRPGLRLRRRPRAGARRLQSADRRPDALGIQELEGAGAAAAASCKENPAAHRQDQASLARCVRDRFKDARVERRTQLPYFCRRPTWPLDNTLGCQSK